MKHLRKGRIFGRTTKKRHALIKGLSESLIKRERLVTTEAKAKSLRPFVEKIVTKSKKNDLATLKYLHSFLSKDAVKKVNSVLFPRYQSRAGGYTRVTKIAPRKSDGSPMAIIEFVK